MNRSQRTHSYRLGLLTCSTPLCVISVCILISTVFINYTSGQTRIDRQSFFDQCATVISQHRSFQAIDHDKDTTFYLRRTVIEGAGRQNINRIFDDIERTGAPTDVRQVAYILATAYRETMQLLEPIREGFPCRTEECIHKHVKAGYAQAAKNGKSYFGRGFVQLTHAGKYMEIGRLLHMSPETALFDEPDRALEPDIAARILVEGMSGGWFTGKRLSDYFNEETEDWVGARQIVNPGSYRAPVTAGYGKLFLVCLETNGAHSSPRGQ
jgi:hypothetical protein